jgi:hypothetical protein
MCCVTSGAKGVLVLYWYYIAAWDHDLKPCQLQTQIFFYPIALNTVQINQLLVIESLPVLHAPQTSVAHLLATVKINRVL